MEFKQLQQKTVAELKKMLAEERAKLHGLRLKLSVNQLSNVREVRAVRKNIAQIRTQITTLEKSEKVS